MAAKSTRSTSHRRKDDETLANELRDARRALAEQGRTLERLNFLIEASKALNSTLDLAEVMKIILDMTTAQTGADRASLFLVDHERNELWSLVAQGLEQKEIRLPAGRGIAGFVAQSGELVNLEDAHKDERFDKSFDQASGYRTRGMLALPVKDRTGKIVGVLQVLNKKTGAFTKEDITSLQDISVHAALALENARLHHESKERQRLEREMKLAREIQRRLLPDAPPKVPGFDLAVRHESSLQVGGDYYDFLKLDNQTQLFVVADVEGKGASSAMIMSNLQATLHAVAKHVHSIEGVVFHLNQGIQLSTRGQKYMTLFLGLIDVPRKSLHYINAGHVPPVVLRKDGTAIPLEEGGMVIGLFPDARYKRGFQKLESGDLILACTDGISEASGPSGDMYLVDGMVAGATRHRAGTAQEIVDGIFNEVTAFSAGGPQPDDKVLMVIKVD